jgi:endonuclease/exonuclease/phosphatase family metal-dependent hydrolase
MVSRVPVTRASLPTRLRRGLLGLATELLLLFLPACSQLPAGDDEAFGVIENSGSERPVLPETLRVVSWNVHGLAAARNPGHVRAVADVIRESGADVVLLQEVHRGTRAGGGGDQFAEIVERTGMNGCFGKSFDVEPGGAYGNVILSRAPLVASRTVRLPGTGEPRTLLRCDSQWGEVDVPLMTTHLVAWDFANRRERGTQVAAIAARLAADVDPLTIFGGDFNAAQQAPEMLALRERFPLRPVDRTRLATCRAFGWLKGLSYDHLFAGDGWSARGASIVRRGPSDHWPVAATLDRSAATLHRSGPAGATG